MPDKAPDDIRAHLIECSEHIRVAMSAISKAQTALGSAMHADSFAKQARYLQEASDAQN